MSLVKVKDCKRPYPDRIYIRHIRHFVRLVREKTVWPFPPIDVVKIGPNKYEILDGYHRVEAAKLLGIKEITANIIKKRLGVKNGNDYVSMRQNFSRYVGEA